MLEVIIEILCIYLDEGKGVCTYALYVWEHIVSLSYRTIRWIFTKLGSIDKITVEDRVSDSFKYIFWNDIAPNSDKSSEYELKNIPNFFRSLWYL